MVPAGARKAAALPGVKFAEVTTSLPYSDAEWLGSFAIEDHPAMPGKFQAALRPVVSAGYFRSLNIPILQGRGFTESDTADSIPVAVVTRRLAGQYSPSQDPIGRRVRLGAGRASHDLWLRIVGVADEVQYGLWNDAPQLVIYTNMVQFRRSAPPSRSGPAAIRWPCPMQRAKRWRRSTPLYPSTTSRPVPLFSSRIRSASFMRPQCWWATPCLPCCWRPSASLP